MVNARDIESVSPNALQLYFDGDACNEFGCVKIAFVGRFLIPLQDFLKAERSYLAQGDVGKRGKTKDADCAEVFLTQVLPADRAIVLAFPWEPSMFEEPLTSQAIKHAIRVLEAAQRRDVSYLSLLGDRQGRYLSNLLKLLGELHGEASGLTIVHAGASVTMSPADVRDALKFLKTTFKESRELILDAILDGMMLQSSKFEATLQDGGRIHGALDSRLGESDKELIASEFINKACKLHIKEVVERRVLTKPKHEYILRNVTENA